MPKQSMNVGPGGKGPGSDASMITAMRRAAVNVNFMRAATSGFTVPANDRKAFEDRLKEKGFTESRYTSVVVGRGLFDNFLKTV
jgi:hypothetical protein